jgi:hypothetical protein
MSTYGQKLGSGWSAAGLTDVFNSALPGDYMQAGQTYKPDNKWGNLFEGVRDDGSQKIDSFQEFMALQKNPNKLVNAIVQKNSPDFLLAQMRFN